MDMVDKPCEELKLHWQMTLPETARIWISLVAFMYMTN